ncbi:proline/betaine transporter [Rickettsia asembonensis]|nr:proline/betaine transporter [Rickettsia asembonensis]
MHGSKTRSVSYRGLSTVPSKTIKNTKIISIFNWIP